jgi:hypothetical protein
MMRPLIYEYGRVADDCDVNRKGLKNECSLSHGGSLGAARRVSSFGQPSPSVGSPADQQLLVESPSLQAPISESIVIYHVWDIVLLPYVTQYGTDYIEQRCG